MPMNQCESKQWAPLSCDREPTPPKGPPKNEVEQLVEAIAHLNKSVEELACMLEPILLRPGPQERDQAVNETKATSPLMEHVRDARNAVHIIRCRITDMTQRIRL